MRILLTTLLLFCFIGFAKAQTPTAQSLVNAYRCKSEDCVNQARATCGYTRIKPDSSDKYWSYYVYKPTKPVSVEMNRLTVMKDYFYIHYVTKAKSNSEALMKAFKALGFGEDYANMDTDIDGRKADFWQLSIPGDYTILATLIYYKKEGNYEINLGPAH
jgi:hypothetical protein